MIYRYSKSLKILNHRWDLVFIYLREREREREINPGFVF